MPHLLVNLEDQADCRKAMEILRRRSRGEQGSRGPKRKADCEDSQDTRRTDNSDHKLAALPLPQKLKRIQSRGMWKHLLGIAQKTQQPLSLTELDELLGLPKNKMRSLKAIMAKLENRFDVRFLKVDPDGSVDGAGNPRYIMPPRVRKQILRLEDA